MGLKTEKAYEYRKLYPNKPTKALARILYSENKLLYKDVEDARGALRYIEGKRGNKDRKLKTFQDTRMSEPRPYNPYKLPESDEIKIEPYEIVGHKRVGIISDCHLPYHNIEAITTMIEYFKKDKIDGLLLNGDVLDFYGISRFVKDPNKRSVPGELDIFKELISVLEGELKCQIYYKLGNHELRWEHFIWQKAGEIVGLEEFKFEEVIKKRAPNLILIGDKRVIKLNELNGIHGHEYPGGMFSPVNVARGLYTKGHVSAFQAHSHISSEHTETDMDGKITTTWSIGCSCELRPAYKPLSNWNHGFAIVDLDDDGEHYEFRNKRIYKGRIL